MVHYSISLMMTKAQGEGDGPARNRSCVVQKGKKKTARENINEKKNARKEGNGRRTSRKKKKTGEH
jgi:hypothetical protein